MEISNVLAGIAVRDLDASKGWYQALFGRPADAEPMAGLAEWHTPGGVVQLVGDGRRAGGSLVTIQVADARKALEGWAERGGPQAQLDDTSSDKVLFATVTDPDGNAVTIVEVRAGVTL